MLNRQYFTIWVVALFALTCVIGPAVADDHDAPPNPPGQSGDNPGNGGNPPGQDKDKDKDKDKNKDKDKDKDKDQNNDDGEGEPSEGEDLEDGGAFTKSKAKIEWENLQVRHLSGTRSGRTGYRLFSQHGRPRGRGRVAHAFNSAVYHRES